MEPLTILAIIQAVVAAGGSIADFVVRFRQRLQQDGELTPEQEAEFDKTIAQITSQPHWQPTPPPVPPTNPT